MANRQLLIQEYIAQVNLHTEANQELKKARLEHSETKKEFDKTETDLKSLQCVGQMMGEVVKEIGTEQYIVKASSGPRYLVTARRNLNVALLKPGIRVALDLATLTIMRVLPKEVDPAVFKMMTEDPGTIGFDQVGGLQDQLQDVREVVELPLTNPELFKRIGIKPPKGVLLYGPPGTGKTLIARALAYNVSATFLKVVASSIVDKYVGESSRMIREIFGYAKENQPCIVFIDEIDAIGGKRTNEGTSADREIQRTLLELLNQIDGFDDLGMVKLIMATNRPDILDPALLRPGRMDRRVEIPIPNETARYDILRIHMKPIKTDDNIDLEPIVKLTDKFNGADLRNICTEAGLFAIRDERNCVTQDDMNRAARKLKDSKSLENKLEYQKDMLGGES